MKTLDWKIKICGVVSVNDARLAVDAGADAIGLNFFPRSLRYVDLATAQAITVATAGSNVARVGVFVNHDLAEIRRIAETCRLDWIQFHGDERTESMALREVLQATGFIRALQPRPDHPAAALTSALAWHRAGVDAILLDAPRMPSAETDGNRVADNAPYGGTGQQTDWNFAQELVHQLPLPVILAGGLTPANVADAIAAVHPAAVDVASGVETFPGKKSSELAQAFVQAANTGFRELKADDHRA